MSDASASGNGKGNFSAIWSSAEGLTSLVPRARKRLSVFTRCERTLDKQSTRKMDAAWYDNDRLKSLGQTEALIQRTLDTVISREQEALSIPGTEANSKLVALTKRLIKAGYEDGGLVPHKTLATITSLMKGIYPFLNREAWDVGRRRIVRSSLPKDAKGKITEHIVARISCRYECNAYFADRARRFADRQPEVDAAQRSEVESLRAEMARISTMSRESTSAREPKAKMQDEGWKDLLQDANRATPKKGFNKGFVELVVRTRRRCANPGFPSSHRTHTRRLGRTRSNWRAQVRTLRDAQVGMSLFQMDKIANLAANDFLRDPILMMAAYLEWSAGARALARSGQLSLAASKGARAATLFLRTPALTRRSAHPQLALALSPVRTHGVPIP